MRSLTLPDRPIVRKPQPSRCREFRIRLLALTTIVTFGSSASAELFRPGDTIPQVSGELFSWDVGDPGSSFSGWDNFSLGGGDPNQVPSTYTPDVTGQFGTPSLLQLNSGGSFLTSGGNLYSFAAAQDFTATVNSGGSSGAAGDSFTRIVAQFQSLGTELDYESILLSSETGSAGTIAPNLLVETGRTDLGGFGGTEVRHLAVWDLASAQDAFRLDFNAAGSSMSLDQFSLNTRVQSTPFGSVTAVPEPAGWAGLAAAGIGFAAWRARRRRHRRGEARPQTGAVAVG